MCQVTLWKLGFWPLQTRTLSPNARANQGLLGRISSAGQGPGVSERTSRPYWNGKERVSHTVMSLFVTLWTVSLQAPLSWDSPGKNTGVGILLQGIFPTRGSHLGLPHCRQFLYHLSYQETTHHLNYRYQIDTSSSSHALLTYYELQRYWAPGR